MNAFANVCVLGSEIAHPFWNATLKSITKPYAEATLHTQCSEHKEATHVYAADANASLGNEGQK